MKNTLSSILRNSCLLISIKNPKHKIEREAPAKFQVVAEHPPKKGQLFVLSPRLITTGSPLAYPVPNLDP